jgi:hypothetical protein
MLGGLDETSRSHPGASGLVISETAAADQTCKAKATKQKLAGEALISFVKKCESDAYLTCAEQAVRKKLAGPASDSFIDKCATKAMGRDLGGAYPTIVRTIQIARAATGVVFAGRDSAASKSADSKTPPLGARKLSHLR